MKRFTSRELNQDVSRAKRFALVAPERKEARSRPIYPRHPGHDRRSGVALCHLDPAFRQGAATCSNGTKADLIRGLGGQGGRGSRVTPGMTKV